MATWVIMELSNCRDNEVCCTEIGMGVLYVDVCGAQTILA